MCYLIIAPEIMIDSAHFRLKSCLIVFKIRVVLSRLLISEKLEISPTSITGLMIDGHSNLPLRNSITVGGIHLLSENSSIRNSSDNENWSQTHTNVNN